MTCICRLAKRGDNSEKTPGGSKVGWLLGVIINDSIVHIPGEAVVVRLQELVVSGMLDHVWSAQAVQVPLASHITHCKAAAVWGPVTVHQLDVICPAAVHIRPCVQSREAAQPPAIVTNEAASFLGSVSLVQTRPDTAMTRLNHHTVCTQGMDVYLVSAIIMSTKHSTHSMQR